MIYKLGLASALLLQLTVAHVVKREDDKPLSLRLGILAAERGLDGLGGDIDDDIFERQILEVTCSACSERLQEREPLICCRCIKDTAVCNNDFGSSASGEGATCGDCLFNECSSECNEIGGIDIKQGPDSNRKCPQGRKLCCDPVDQLFGENQGGDVCRDSDTQAIMDFDKGVVCGKRDSRVYYNAKQPPTFTNPGEWPWAVLIYDQGNNYRGAGALVSNNVVVTVAHKVQNYVDRASSLKVRLGDWNPNRRDRDEDFDFVEREVDCVILHPDQDLTNTLANNVAVLKLRPRDDFMIEEMEKNVKDVITLYSNAQDLDIEVRTADDLERPGNRVEGVRGSRIIQTRSAIDLRLGLVADSRDLDGLGGRLGGSSSSGSGRPSPIRIVEPSYYNTVCLPSSSQFRNYRDRCWVASWGNRQERQREISLPLLSSQECSRRLGNTFEEKGVPNWRPQPSEVCAGGVEGEDTCRGEGGAPLVCYDDSSDQYFLVGLVGYGFECNTTLPGVYTNIADPVVRDFIDDAIDNEDFCGRRD